MALQKEYTVKNNGFTGNYWRISGCQIFWDDDVYKIFIGLYKDEAARLAGKKPIINAYAVFPIPEDDTKFTREVAYYALKFTNIFVEDVNNPDFFNGATDV